MTIFGNNSPLLADKDVFVAGRPLKRDGSLLVGDLSAARAASRVQAARLWKMGKARSGLS